MIKILFFAFIVCSGIYSWGQTIIPRFENLSVNDGLPHSSVYSILQDKKGFMWFGTPDGLCRYDGSILLGIKYKPSRPGSVVNNFVRGKMLEDKEGNIWYCNESGIYKWNVHKEIIERVKEFKRDEFSNVAFRSIKLDDNGSLWLFNVVHGIFEFNIFSGKFTQYPLPARRDYSTVILSYEVADVPGNIWIHIISNNDPYLLFDINTHHYSTQLAEDPPHAIFFSKQNTVLAFEDRLEYKDLTNNQVRTVKKVINNKKVKFYSFDGIRDNYGRLWMTARGNGLFYYDEQNDQFHEYHHDNSKLKSLPFNLTTCLYIDRNQNLWIGIDGGGVAKLDLKQPKFNLFPLSEGDHPILKDYFTKCFYEDEKQRIWFGSQSNGLSILNNKTNELINFHHKKDDVNSLPGDIVAGILKDRDGNMWIGSSGGISLFDEGKASFKTININQLPQLHPEMNVFVYKMIQLKSGDLLAATLLGLVSIVKQQDGNFKGHYFSNNVLLNNSTTDITEMPGGIVYATVPGFGLYELQPTGKGYTLLNVFLKGIDLRSLRIDETDAEWLWISSGIGLIHFNTKSKKFIIWNEKQGLANSYIYGSLEDEKNNLWISTNGGLSYLNRANNKVDNYSYQDGLQSNEFNTQAFYKSNSNNFYFGGIKGFNWFQSKKNTTQLYKPQVAITQVDVENVVFTGDAIFSLQSARKLSYDSNDLNFKFAVLDYTRPEANGIQYRLEGWDTKWIKTYTRSVRYSNLPPGNYTIIVKAVNAAGIWSDEEKLSLIIKNPYWKTWWFYLLELLIVAGVIVWITRVTTQRKLKKQIEKLERQKELAADRMRISQEMHDDIGAGLTQISLISESANNRSHQGIIIKNELDDISATARQLVNNIGEIIWYLNPEHNTLDILFAHLREQISKLTEYSEIECKIDFPDSFPAVELTNQQRRNLLLVTKEIVHNAIKHSRAKRIYIFATIQNSRLIFEITDNGIGFDAAIPVNGNGLRNIRQRIAEIGGKMDFLPGMDSGSQVIYSIPLP